MKRVSIRDIAKQAGVVPSTVSFVLNGKAKQMRISDAVAGKIIDLAKKTGYTPNHSAVCLRTGKSNILGLIVEDISNVFFASLAKTIEKEAYAHGYKIVYCSTENDDNKGIELLKMLVNQQVDGYLITPSSGMKQDISKLVGAGQPVVLMDRFFRDAEIPHILVDNYDGVMQGMNHLRGKGYSKIAFVSINLDQVQMDERERAYIDSMNSAGEDDPMQFVLKLDYKGGHEQSIADISDFLKKHPDLEAIFFATNYIGVYGLESIRQCGLSIPSDLAVICFDDHDIFRLFSPGITIIRQPIDHIARQAVRLLIRQIDKQDVSKEDLHVYLKSELVERAST